MKELLEQISVSRWLPTPGCKTQLNAPKYGNIYSQVSVFSYPRAAEAIDQAWSPTSFGYIWPISSTVSSEDVNDRIVHNGKSPSRTQNQGKYLGTLIDACTLPLVIATVSRHQLVAVDYLALR
jgi:hypothetical protein